MLNSLPKVYANGQKQAFIFAGYNGTPTKPLYQAIGRTYKSLGITPIFVEIDWSTNDIKNYISQARDTVKSSNSRKNYFYGFSMGGLIALKMASEFGAEKVVVSSVAPFFFEDISRLPWYSPHKIYNWWLFGNSRSISLDEILETLNQNQTNVTLLVGANESQIMLARSEHIANSLADAKHIVMENIGHGLSQKGHIDYINSALTE